MDREASIQVEVFPGMFKSERLVVIPGFDQTYQALVDICNLEEDLSGKLAVGRLLVYPISDLDYGDRIYVDLPDQDGQRICIPRGNLLPPISPDQFAPLQEVE